ncbi:MAG: polysaccharide deacetylase family protein [Thermoanaerobaculia bacterium]
MKKLALKVDVDTYRGTLEGVPRLVDLFEKHRLKATFFFSLGPDTSGKAIKRVFRKGFIEKVLSASPAASYGLRTMLYGTLLPAPDIGGRGETVARMREAAAAGHSVGIHAWDHIDWHDRLPRMERAEIEDVVAKEHARFRAIFGKPATLQAAPGWTATPLSVEVQEAHGLVAASDTRGGEPFFPMRADGTPSRVLEIPSTLPTLDELLAVALPGAGTQIERACEFLRRGMREGAGSNGGVEPAAPAPGEAADRAGIEVHSIHTEIEGGAVFAAPFADLLAAWKSDGVTFLTFEEICRLLLSAETPARSEREQCASAPAGSAREQIAISTKRLGWTTLPGRATPVATGVPLPA